MIGCEIRMSCTSRVLCSMIYAATYQLVPVMQMDPNAIARLVCSPDGGAKGTMKIECATIESKSALSDSCYLVDPASGKLLP